MRYFWALAAIGLICFAIGGLAAIVFIICFGLAYFAIGGSMVKRHMRRFWTLVVRNMRDAARRFAHRLAVKLFGSSNGTISRTRVVLVALSALAIAFICFETANSTASAVTIKGDSHGRIARFDGCQERFQARQSLSGHRSVYRSLPRLPDRSRNPAQDGWRADVPGNMQWQTKEEAKAKDKIECGGRACSAR
jgi:hypothetical protein